MREGPGEIVHGVSQLTDHDVYLFKQGSHFRLYERLGAHSMTVDGTEGTHFAVWAPNAKAVSVIGDFNAWSRDRHPLSVRLDGSGIWEGFIPGVRPGTSYKYHIRSRKNGYTVDKGDPFAFFWEVPPATASRIWDLGYDWQDGDWMRDRGGRQALDSPFSVYELHLGSWKRKLDENNRSLTYREAGDALASYVQEMGFTHVELMPVMEHPFYGSWGYQVSGFFAPTSRYGSPQDLMYLIDVLHQAGIGVILDWVPSHFPSDEHGLNYFDGTHLYEHADPRKGTHPEWQSILFNYGRHEVRSFLTSAALFWLDRYHADALRLDAVASMLYLDYGRQEGEWIPNEHGGNENTDAIEFLRTLNKAVYAFYPDTQTIAEESTAWPMVTRPTYVGGLGFGMKWNMGWMHDTLAYFSLEPIHRKFHTNQITFGIWYAFSENFLLPFSHDEVVYGKGSLMRKMPGDDWQKAANLRALLGFMYASPGKKLLFMGGEFGQWSEWYHESGLEWHLLEQPLHRGVQAWMQDLNRAYRAETALHEIDFASDGFEWVDFHDSESSVISFLRKGSDPAEAILAVFNLTPVVRYAYRLGAPAAGLWEERLNSDAEVYGGSGVGNLGGVEAEPVPFMGRPNSVSLTLPPLAALFLKRRAP